MHLRDKSLPEQNIPRGKSRHSFGFSRLFWTCVSFTFAFLTVYNIAKLFLGYQQSPIKVDVGRDYPSIGEGMDFPAVMICNTMPFRYKRQLAGNNGGIMIELHC